MEPLATVSKLQSRLTVDITDTERAQQLLKDASAAVRSYTGQEFTAGTTTARFRVKRNEVRLPQQPVTDVTAVVDTNGNSVLFEWDGADRVRVSSNLDTFAAQPWATGVTLVDVTYDHGYDQVPDDIVLVVCQVAGRALGTSPDAAAMSSESLGSYSYSTGGAAASGAAGMLAAERAILDRYRHQVSSITVSA